ncbi:aminoglycoside phosphotransferase family protein [Stenotrophomonas sp. TWI1149]
MHELPATKWQLHRDGDVIETPRGRLWPVRLPDGTPAMLKMSTHAEEPNGHLLLDWWDGDGATRAGTRVSGGSARCCPVGALWLPGGAVTAAGTVQIAGAAAAGRPARRAFGLSRWPFPSCTAADAGSCARIR